MTHLPMLGRTGIPLLVNMFAMRSATMVLSAYISVGVRGRVLSMSCRALSPVPGEQIWYMNRTVTNEQAHI